MPITIEVLQCYRNVTLAGDVMYVNGIRFINTISYHINFMMAEHITNAESSTLQKSIKSLSASICRGVFKPLTSLWIVGFNVPVET